MRVNVAGWIHRFWCCFWGLVLVFGISGSMVATASVRGPDWFSSEGLQTVIGQVVQEEGIDPVPWYRTPWAVVGYAVVGTVLILLVVQWCTSSLWRKRQELERMVAERASEIKNQKQQLEAYNRELLRTNQTLRQALEEKAELLAVTAHDLKNPLFGIRALAEILLETETGSEKTTRKLDLIRESADETLQLIDRLLSSAAGAAQHEVEPRKVDLVALTQWSVRSFAPQADRKGQSLQCRVQTDCPCVVDGDKRKLREAINNLVSNALKYSDNGASVEVIVDRDDDSVSVSVVDCGPGLGEDDLQRMFAPFQRLTPAPTGDESSSGLGLYIVRQIAELHDGTVNVETALGDGSTFTLVLPATLPGAPSVPEVNPEEVDMPTRHS